MATDNKAMAGQEGDALGFPAAGKRFETVSANVGVVRDGKAAEHWPEGGTPGRHRARERMAGPFGHRVGGAGDLTRPVAGRSSPHESLVPSRCD